MLDHSNTVNSDDRPEKIIKKTSKSCWKIFFYVLIVFFFVICLPIGFGVYKYPALARSILNFINIPTDQIASRNGNVSILVMGKSGGDRDGAELTDTMILISVPLDASGVEMISLPRDIWVPEIRAKINSAYYWGKNGSPYFDISSTGGGIAFARKIVGEITGYPIQYGLVVDFSSFKDIVDALGGIEVNVNNGFTDNLYPISGKENDNCGGDITFACRYETIIFNSGLQKMNGETALKSVRSRHAGGDEGTDIARESRQQLIISAIKNKIMEPKTYLSINTDIKMINIAKKYIETDIDIPTAGVLARSVFDGSKNITQLLIPEGLLINPPTSKTYDNLYVFIPRAGNGKWEEIQEWFSSIMDN